MNNNRAVRGNQDGLYVAQVSDSTQPVGLQVKRFAQILFRKSNSNAQTIVRPFTSNLIDIQDALYKLRTSRGDRVPGYRLDAILERLNEIDFRPEAEKHFVVVTNSALQTTQNAKTDVERIIEQCERGDIHVNMVGGVARPIQARLVNQN